MIWLLVGVLIALLIAALLTKKVTQPINLLINLTHQSEKGYDAVDLGKAPKNTPTEIRKLWISFSNLLSGLQSSNKEIKRLNVSLQEDIQRATSELQEMNKSLYITSTQDYLTSLSNRRHFTHFLEEVLKTHVGKNVGILMIDIDEFKQLNDQYGHEAGDLALQHLSGILKRLTRSCDLVARLGGDEFIIYIQNPTDEHLLTRSEKIRCEIIDSPLVLKGKSLHFTLSIGTVNQFNNGELSIQSLFRFSDKAMYDSKLLGRNRVSTYNAAIEAAV